MALNGVVGLAPLPLLPRQVQYNHWTAVEDVLSRTCWNRSAGMTEGALAILEDLLEWASTRLDGVLLEMRGR